MANPGMNKAIKKIKQVLSKSFKRVGRLFNRDNNIYLIYTMGKVGSSTIYNSLRKEKPFADIFHVHFLSKNWLENKLPKAHKNFHYNIKAGYDILNFIKTHPGKRIKVVTLVREPVMRAISDLFQNWRSLYDDIEKIEQEELRRHIEGLDHQYVLNWFDTEFYEYLKIDLYSLPFDKKKGYEIYRFDNLDILCIKLESLNAIETKVFTEFLGIKSNLVNTNLSINKKGSGQYSYLKRSVKLGKEKLDGLYNSKLVKHFYTPEEVDGFVKKWLR